MWARCGAMALTGDAGGPPLAPPSPAAVVAGDLASRFGLDAGVLGERAAVAGFTRQGRTSCGGATRLLRAGDGWVALSLARDDDVALLPAMLGVEAADRDGAWAVVADAVGSRLAGEVEERAALVGVPCSVVGASSSAFFVSGSPRPDAVGACVPLVVDLSALWAGPLCTHLLQRAGARVVKVEDPARPDGARSGPPAFFDLLNAGKSSVAVEFGSHRGRARLQALVAAADVVVTSARSRVFDQLGLAPDDVLATKADKVWVAVTGHGWGSDRVGFGDDAAAAAGLVAWHPIDGDPRFAADAVADPLCGLMAAGAALDALAAGGRWFVDASLAGAAARVAPPAGAPAVAATPADGGWSIDGERVAPPAGRPPAGRGPALGAHTEAVLRDLAG